MDGQITLNRKKLWILGAALTWLCLLIFIAGWLSGLMMNPSPAPAASSDQTETNPRIIRQKVPPRTEAVKKAAVPVPPAPAKIPAAQVPRVRVPRISVPRVNALKKPMGTVRTVQRLARTLRTPSQDRTRPAAADKDTAEKAADKASPAGDAGPKPAETQPAEKKHEAFTPEYPYSLQLASYRNRARAERAIADYRKKGISAYFVQVDLGAKGVWWRVYNGYYRNRQEAMAYRTERNLPEAQIIRTRWANLIGILEDEAAVDSLIDRLREKAFSPYVIRAEDQQFRLFTGAFTSRKDAENQRRLLTAEGFREVRTVQR